MAKVLINLGFKKAMIVYGMDKLDEASVSAPTSICEVSDGVYERYVITSEQFGLGLYHKKDVSGGTPDENANITLSILSGEERGARRDIVLLNSGIALYACERAETIEEGVRLAEKSIDSGSALAKLKEFVRVSHE